RRHQPPQRRLREVPRKGAGTAEAVPHLSWRGAGGEAAPRHGHYSAGDRGGAEAPRGGTGRPGAQRRTTRRPDLAREDEAALALRAEGRPPLSRPAGYVRGGGAGKRGAGADDDGKRADESAVGRA